MLPLHISRNAFHPVAHLPQSPRRRPRLCGWASSAHAPPQERSSCPLPTAAATLAARQSSLRACGGAGCVGGWRWRQQRCALAWLVVSACELLHMRHLHPGPQRAPSSARGRAGGNPTCAALLPASAPAESSIGRHDAPGAPQPLRRGPVQARSGPYCCSRLRLQLGMMSDCCTALGAGTWARWLRGKLLGLLGLWAATSSLRRPWGLGRNDQAVMCAASLPLNNYDCAKKGWEQVPAKPPRCVQLLTDHRADAGDAAALGIRAGGARQGNRLPGAVRAPPPLPRGVSAQSSVCANAKTLTRNR